METDPGALSAYIQFLSFYLPLTDMQKMAGLALVSTTLVFVYCEEKKMFLICLNYFYNWHYYL